MEELQHLLKIATEKVHERETEILIKKQELEDLKETYLGKMNKDEESENVMQEQISKVKALQAKISEYENVIKGKNTTINEHEEFIKKL